MNNDLELAAERRNVTGKKVKQLRREGLVPATLYGHEGGSVSLQVQRDDLVQLIGRAGKSAVFGLKVGREKAQPALVKALQYHPTTRQPLHADFYRVALNEKLKTRVPLRFVGEAPVAKAHDVAIVRPMDEVAVECYPADLPAAVDVDLARLEEVGATIRVSDLDAGPRVAILDPADEVVASVAESAKEVIEALETAAERAAEAEEKAEAVPEAAEAATPES